MKHKPKSPQDFTAIVRPTIEDGDVVFEAKLKEFGLSVVGRGPTPNDALECLYEDVATFIEILQERGKTVPVPQEAREWDDFSGKITLRMPRSLHYKLSALAEDEDVSLNLLAVSILSCGAELRHCLLRPQQPTSIYNSLIFASVHSLPLSKGKFPAALWKMNEIERPTTIMRSALP